MLCQCFGYSLVNVSTEKMAKGTLWNRVEDVKLAFSNCSCLLRHSVLPLAASTTFLNTNIPYIYVYIYTYTYSIPENKGSLETNCPSGFYGLGLVLTNILSADNVTNVSQLAS